jgi:hypothetical protein
MAVVVVDGIRNRFFSNQKRRIDASPSEDARHGYAKGAAANYLPRFNDRRRGKVLASAVSARRGAAKRTVKRAVAE